MIRTARSARLYSVVTRLLICVGAAVPLLVLSAGSLFYSLTVRDIDQILSGSSSSQPELLTIQSRLEISQRLFGGTPEIYRALGRVHSLQGRAAEAVVALEQAYRKQPDSLQILGELALAYERDNQFDRALSIWERLSFTPDLMTTTGSAYLADGFYAEALTWYRRGLRFSALSTPETLFQQAIAAIASNDPEAQTLLRLVQQRDPLLKIFPTPETIPGADFRWLVSPDGRFPAGTRLDYTTGQDQYGVFWWSGHAIALVDVKQSSEHLLSVNASNTLAGPVQLAIGIDGQRRWQAQLTRNDTTAELLTFVAKLEPGVHIIDIWFLNDGVTDIGPRDAIINFVRLEEYTK